VNPRFLRERDQVLRRIRTLISESADEGRIVQLEAKRREIARLKSELAEAVKRNAASEGEPPDR
jgi:hypothetical protein